MVYKNTVDFYLYLISDNLTKQTNCSNYFKIGSLGLYREIIILLANDERFVSL